MRCGSGRVAALTKEGELWDFQQKMLWSAPATLLRETSFPNAKDVDAEALALCSVGLDGSLHCCGRFGSNQVGDGPPPGCHPVLVRAETAVLPPSSAVAPNPSKSP